MKKTQPASNIKYTVWNAYYKARERRELWWPGRYLTLRGAKRIVRRITQDHDAQVDRVEHIELS